MSDNLSQPANMNSDKQTAALSGSSSSSLPLRSVPSVSSHSDSRGWQSDKDGVLYRGLKHTKKLLSLECERQIESKTKMLEVILTAHQRGLHFSHCSHCPALTLLRDTSRHNWSFVAVFKPVSALPIGSSKWRGLREQI